MLAVAVVTVFATLMAYAAASDLLTMTIPNRLSVALAGGFAVFALACGLPLPAIASHVAAGALVLAVTFAMFSLGWIGGGDAKLAAATALWLGFDILLGYLVLAAIGGGLLSILILALRQVPLPAFTHGWPWLLRICDPRSGVPYGIALAAAAILVFPQSRIFLLAAAS